jgi:hydroxymethylpyrimidine pyrophosphatase-like HAD family hydrolase
MRLRVIAVDYDGTTGTDAGLDPAVRAVIGEAQGRGIRVVLVTGRILADLRRVAGSLALFDAVVGENGAVLSVPGDGRTRLLASPPPESLRKELARRNVPVVAGASVIEADAAQAHAVLQIVRDLELPLVIVFNRGRLMLLPQSVSKATGLQAALAALRLSAHNTLAVGDAENDHELLAASEIGAAVQWGSAALVGVADQVVPGTQPKDVGSYLRSVIAQQVILPRAARRHVLLGHSEHGRSVSLAVRGRNTLVMGEPRSGKSWVAGLLAEQLILMGYCLCVLDPEGDYAALEPLPGVVVLGGDAVLPQPREVLRLLRHPDMSLVLNLSRLGQSEKNGYIRMLLPLLAAIRRRTGLPHRIVLDEAHYFLRHEDVDWLLDLELHGYTLVTYRASAMHPSVLRACEEIIACRERSDEEVRALAACHNVPPEGIAHCQEVLGTLRIGEAALLPCTDEAGGRLVRVTLAQRQTAHVRHRTKYLDVPVTEDHAFVFTQSGWPAGPRARTLEQFVDALEQAPHDVVAGHLQRHDVSRWLDDVYADRSLAQRVREAESAARLRGVHAAIKDITTHIQSRYDFDD